VSWIKIFAITYVAGAAIFGLALLVVVLAVIGFETVGRQLNMAFPLVGGFILMMGSKYAAAAALRRGERA